MRTSGRSTWIRGKRGRRRRGRPGREGEDLVATAGGGREARPRRVGRRGRDQSLRPGRYIRQLDDRRQGSEDGAQRRRPHPLPMSWGSTWWPAAGSSRRTDPKAGSGRHRSGPAPARSTATRTRSGAGSENPKRTDKPDRVIGVVSEFRKGGELSAAEQLHVSLGAVGSAVQATAVGTPGAGAARHAGCFRGEPHRAHAGGRPRVVLRDQVAHPDSRGQLPAASDSSRGGAASWPSSCSSWWASASSGCCGRISLQRPARWGSGGRRGLPRRGPPAGVLRAGHPHEPGVLLGAVLVLQLPIFEPIGFIRSGVYMTGFLVAVAAIYLLATLCALYPSTLVAPGAAGRGSALRMTP